MLTMRAPAVRVMRLRPRAVATLSNLLATPHGTGAGFAAIHQLISSFRVRANNPEKARITSISGTPATRRRRVGGNGASLKGFAFTVSPSSGGPRPRPQKGPAALPDCVRVGTLDVLGVLELSSISIYWYFFMGGAI